MPGIAAKFVVADLAFDQNLGRSISEIRTNSAKPPDH